MLKSQVRDSRSRDILKKALALFAKIGYNQLNYREIAEHCGLNRTAIYHYFPNKRAVFAAALEQLFADLAADFRRNVETHPELGEADKIEMVMRQAIELICRNPELVRSIHEYLLSQVRQGENVARKVRRHTIVVRWTLIRLSRDAVRNGGKLKPRRPGSPDPQSRHVHCRHAHSRDSRHPAGAGRGRNPYVEPGESFRRARHPHRQGICRGAAAA